MEQSNDTAIHGLSSPLDDLLRTFIAALQEYASKPKETKIDNPGIEPLANITSAQEESSTRRPSIDSQQQIEIHPVKARIGRSNEDGGWINQHMWENVMQDEQRSPTPQEPFAILYREVSGKKQIFLRSPCLRSAYLNNTQHPILNSKIREADEIFEAEPFPNLWRNLNAIRSEIEQLNDESAKLDFEALEFLSREWEKRWKDAEEEKDKDGFVRYGNVWKLFNPGDLVIRKDSLGNKLLLVLLEVMECSETSSNGNISGEFVEFTTWGLGWDRTHSKIRRKVAIFRLWPYKDRRHITLLPVYPLERDSPESKHLLDDLSDRGKKWQKYMLQRTSCLLHQGVANPTNRETSRFRDERSVNIYLNEKVVIDEVSKRESISGLLGVITPRDDLEAIQFDDRVDYKWDDIDPYQPLTDKQAQLCPAVVACFSIKSQDPFIVSVDNLKPVPWNISAIQNLVMDKEKRDLLRDLVQDHSTRTEGNETADLVENKGKGLVIVLHGPPGVGKTLTAECISEHVGKPLIALSIGDLIVDESNLERRLSDAFERALQWDAILLLDEADVVLEARSFEDVRRNGIVSVFLRSLEYYQGVLFLTTNRISTMDPAFQSRIQVAIEYEELNRETRANIWTSHIARRKTSLESKSYAKILDQIEYLSQYRLNGRQIRNSINIAEGLAFAEFRKSGQMEFKHIDKAVKATHEFQEFFDGARRKAQSGQSVWAPFHGDLKSF